MGKITETSEVQVLRFFEEGPIEKAEVVFNIVAEKMRARLGARRGALPVPADEPGAGRKRREKPAGPPAASGETPAQELGA